MILNEELNIFNDVYIFGFNNLEKLKYKCLLYCN